MKSIMLGSGSLGHVHRRRPKSAYLFVIVVKDLPIRQRHVAEEMMGADHAAHRKVGDRGVDMRNEVQPSWADPRTFDGNFGEIVRDELTDFGPAIDAGYEFEIDLCL
jgi:hypothetical protein